jgi:hypothetical protein
MVGVPVAWRKALGCGVEGSGILRLFRPGALFSMAVRMRIEMRLS